jgi:hypothetical protein
VLRWLIGPAVLAAVLYAPAVSFAAAPSSNDGVIVEYKAQPVLNMTVTPNYATGYGAIETTLGGTTGTLQSTPGTTVDFGNVYQGAVYLYRFAAHVSVKSNTHYALYGEGSADLTGPSGTIPLAQSLYWLNSTSGGTDANTGYSASTPFQATTAPGAAYDNPTITYVSYPAPIYTSTGNGDMYYDYQLHLPTTAAIGSYSVYVVYTAVPE